MAKKMIVENSTIATKLWECRKRFHSAYPNPDTVESFLSATLTALFPHFTYQGVDDADSLLDLLGTIASLTSTMFDTLQELPSNPNIIITDFIDFLPTLHDTLLEDAHAICAGDPASASLDEVILTYPGFFAISVYRIAHWFDQRNIPLIPRLLTEIAHSKTGIDIHPAATIGSPFVIDHGTGIVIGESTEIKKNVKLYQGVTLGALSVSKDLRDTKRHPTIEENVVIYANATILGGETKIGANSIIGGNVWLISSVPPFSRVYLEREKGGQTTSTKTSN